MSKYKDMAKAKWEDKKSNTTGIRGQVRGKASGLIHRGKKEEIEVANHVSRPLSELRDPSSFAPPPRRTGTGLAPPPPPTTAKRSVVAAPSKYQDPRGPAQAPPPKFSHEDQLLEPEQERALVAPSGPYRADTTGLSTAHLPPPPGRRDGADGRSPPPYETVVAARPVPSLPPRLPARSPGGASPVSAASTGSHSGMLNQGAVNSLGARGVSVPALGIGASPSPHNAGPTSPPPPPRPGGGGGGGGGGGNNTAQLNELQNRFSKLNTSPATRPSPGPAAGGTSWAQKQAALKTASNFQKDPSSVSLSDARSAASTANSFRERHGDQVAAGMRSANSLSQKYGIADKVGAYTGRSGQEQPAAGGEASTMAAAAAAKKKPPPPPKKKPGLGGASPSPSQNEPPPIPMSTRPQF